MFRAAHTVADILNARNKCAHISHYQSLLDIEIGNSEKNREYIRPAQNAKFC